MWDSVLPEAALRNTTWKYNSETFQADYDEPPYAKLGSQTKLSVKELDHFEVFENLLCVFGY